MSYGYRGARKYPCPTCKKANKLTAREHYAGHQCNDCADADERKYGGYPGA